MPRISFPAVLVAALANFLLGWGWYAAFGEAWRRALKKKAEELPGPNDPIPYAVAAAGSLLSAGALAVLLDYARCDSVLFGIFLGASAGLCYAVASTAQHYARGGWSVQLFAIDCGVDLLGFTLMGTILSIMPR